MVNFKIIIISIFSLFFLNNVKGQAKLILEHKATLKTKYLDLERKYYIETNDTAYSNKEIINFNDTRLSITTSTKTDRDTTYFYVYSISKTKDTIYTYTQPIYRQDTVMILFSEINTLKKDWFKNRNWLYPFAWFTIGAAMGVVLLPVAVIAGGKEEFKDWVIFETVLIGISVPPLFIGSRMKKYDLINNWTLKTRI